MPVSRGVCTRLEALPGDSHRGRAMTAACATPSVVGGKLERGVDGPQQLGALLQLCDPFATRHRIRGKCVRHAISGLIHPPPSLFVASWVDTGVFREEIHQGLPAHRGFQYAALCRSLAPHSERDTPGTSPPSRPGTPHFRCLFAVSIESPGRPKIYDTVTTNSRWRFSWALRILQ